MASVEYGRGRLSRMRTEISFRVSGTGMKTLQGSSASGGISSRPLRVSVRLPSQSLSAMAGTLSRTSNVSAGGLSLMGFHLPLLEPLTQIFSLHKVELLSVDWDILLYLQESLAQLQNGEATLIFLIRGLVEKSRPPSPRNHQDSSFCSNSMNLPESARDQLGILHSDVDLREQGKLERREPRSRIVENVVSPRHPWKSWKSHAG